MVRSNSWVMIAIVAAFISCSGGSDIATINVHVEGLRGKLVLQNNGKDDLTIEKDGDYTFDLDKPITEYSVDTIQEPCEQRCTVEDAEGKITNGKVDLDVFCVAKEWEVPNASDKVNLGSNANLIDAKMDKNGDIVVVWSKLFNSDAQIYISEYRKGKWTKPTSLSDRLSFYGYNVLDTKMAMNDNGDVVVLWLQNANSFMNERYIYTAVYHDGIWKKPASLSNPINPDLNEMSWTPGVAINNKGDAIVTWVVDAEYLLKSEYRSGSWTHPNAIGDAINFVGDNGPSNPKTAISDKGEAVIAWSQLDDSANKIFKSEYRSGSWTHPASLSDAYFMSEQGGSVSNVTINEDGDVNMILYGSSQAGFIRPAYFMMTRQNNDWTYPASLGDHFSFTNSNSANLGLSISTNIKGEAFMSWNEDFEHYRAEFKNGQWNMPDDGGDSYNTTSGATYVGHKSAMDDDGNRLLFWKEDADLDGINNIKVIEKREGSWKNIKTILTGSENRNPQGGIQGNSSNCRSILAWEEISNGDNETSDIYVAMYR